MASAAEGPRPLRRSDSYEFLPPSMSELRVVLLGNSWSQKASVGNLLLGQTEFTQHFTRIKVFRRFKDKLVTVVNTPDLMLKKNFLQQLEWGVQVIKALSAPGPHVFLLVLQPEDFTEQHSTRLQSVLESFSEQAFHHSLVLLCTPRVQTPWFMDKCMRDPHIRDMIIKCKYRCVWMNNSEDDFGLKDVKRKELLNKISLIMKDNNDKNLSYQTSNEKGSLITALSPSVKQKSPLNLVLCGRRQTEKTSTAESILGRAGLPAESSPGQCVQHQGEVCGRWVSVVELPALSGKPLEAVMQQSLSCLSLCGPEGVHAFILVLPLGPLTDEDKAEIKTIQDTFSSAVNPFTMILFTVDSDPTAPAVVHSADTDLQELCQSCGGGYLIFNTRGQQQVPELLESVETLKATNKPHSYTTERLQQTHIEKINFLYKELQDTKTKGTKKSDESTDCLRITLIGKTGTGKSSSGNTILGRKQFVTKPSQKPVTKVCQKELTAVEGRDVAVVDTPGLFDTTMTSDEVDVERLRCVNLLAPGPHVFLLVFQPFQRFTEEDRKTLSQIKKGFGKGVEKFTIILLTHGDQLEDSGMSIDEFIIKNSDDSFKQLISECGNRYHVFNNRDRDNRSQVKELLEKIDALVQENGGGCYTNDMLLKAEAAIKKEMEKERQEMERKYKQEIDDLKQALDKEREQNAIIVRELETSMVAMGAEWQNWKEKFLQAMKSETASRKQAKDVGQFMQEEQQKQDMK